MNSYCLDNNLSYTNNNLDNNSINSIDLDDKINDIQRNIIIEINKLNVDNLKELCKEFDISGYSKLKKNELINIITDEYIKITVFLKNTKRDILKNICKYYKIVSNFTVKNIIIVNILNSYFNYLLIIINLITNGNKSEIIEKIRFTLKTLDFIEKSYNMEQIEHKKLNNLVNSQTKKKDVQEKEELENKLKEEENKLKELERKLKEEQENKLKEELERKLKEEQENKLKEELEKKLKEELEKKLKEELENKIKEELENKLKEEVKRKKQSIPKNVKIIIWNHYIGEDIIKHKCLCCKKVTINNTNFEVGHVLSEKNGGTHEINNLRPICFSCNHSMGTLNMIEFVVKYGFYIG
jgi:hypothetical protein